MAIKRILASTILITFLLNKHLVCADDDKKQEAKKLLSDIKDRANNVLDIIDYSYEKLEEGLENAKQNFENANKSLSETKEDANDILDDVEQLEKLLNGEDPNPEPEPEPAPNVTATVSPSDEGLVLLELANDNDYNYGAGKKLFVETNYKGKNFRVTPKLNSLVLESNDQEEVWFEGFLKRNITANSITQYFLIADEDFDVKLVEFNGFKIYTQSQAQKSRLRRRSRK